MARRVVKVTVGGVTRTVKIPTQGTPASGDKATQVFAALRSPTPEVYLKRTSATWLTFFLNMGSGRFGTWDLRPTTTAGADPGNMTLGRSASYIPLATLDDLDASWVYSTSPAWTVASGNHRSSLAGATATWTSPAATVLALKCVPATNCGLALVSIDGSTTAANLLPTAQSLVDSATYPSSILTGNGGTLAPTDRVWDQYGGTLTTRLAADGLSSTAHTVVVTVTGYKRDAASDSRVIIDGGLYYSTAVTPASAGVTMYEDARLFTNGSGNAESNYEDAPRVSTVPPGPNGPVFSGGVHNYETQTGLGVAVNGTPTSLADGQTVAGTNIVVHKTSDRFHPDKNSGTTRIADVSYDYVLNQDGLNLQGTMSWHEPMTVDTSYLGMYPVGGPTDQAGSAGIFDRASSSAVTVDVSMTENGPPPGNRKAAGAFDTAWHYTSTGKYGAAVKLINRATALANDAFNNGIKGFVEDREKATTGSVVALNKVYFPRTADDSTVKETVGEGTVWTWSVAYRVGYFPNGAAAVMART